MTKKTRRKTTRPRLTTVKQRDAARALAEKKAARALAEKKAVQWWHDSKLLDERDARNAEIISGLRKELQAQDFEIARLTSELRGAPVKEDQVPTWLYNQLLDRLLKGGVQ